MAKQQFIDYLLNPEDDAVPLAEALQAAIGVPEIIESLPAIAAAPAFAALSQAYAQTPENTPVPGGTGFSALHWAAKAQGYAATFDLEPIVPGDAGRILAVKGDESGSEWTPFPLSGRIYGLTLSNNVADAVNDIDIAPGHARNTLDTTSMELTVGITKSLDFAWSTGFGGLDTGAKAVSTWYHVWLIKNLTTDAVNVLFSLSATNPTMPAGWAAKRRIGAIGTDAAGTIRPFKQTGGFFGLNTPYTLATAQPNDGNVLRALAVPLGVKMRLKLNAYFTCSAAAAFFACKDPDQGIATTSDFNGYSGAAGQNAAAQCEVFTNPSGQIYTYSNRSETILTQLYFQGWFDQRGGDYADF